MKRVNVRFNQDITKQDIDVTVAASEKDEQVTALMDRIGGPSHETLTVYDSEASAVKIPESAIISITTENKRLKVLTDSGTYELRMTLRDAGNQLDPQTFMQISRYEIINLSKVRRFDFSIAGTLKIELADGTSTWAARRFITEIKNRYMGKE